MVGKGMNVVPEVVRNALEFTACHMVADKVERMKIKGTACAGFLQTEWKVAVVGARAGVLFNSFVEYEDAECQINFLLNQKELEDIGARIAALSDQDPSMGWSHVPLSGDLLTSPLTEFRDLRPRALN